MAGTDDMEAEPDRERDPALDPALAAAIAAAEAAVAGLAGDYVAELARDAAGLEAAGAALAAHAPGTEDHAAALTEAFRISHDIKGQAGAFGFGEAGELAGALCDLLRGRAAAGGDVIGVVRAAARQIAAMAADFDPGTDETA